MGRCTGGTHVLPAQGVTNMSQKQICSTQQKGSTGVGLQHQEDAAQEPQMVSSTSRQRCDFSGYGGGVLGWTESRTGEGTGEGLCWVLCTMSGCKTEHGVSQACASKIAGADLSSLIVRTGTLSGVSGCKSLPLKSSSSSTGYSGSHFDAAVPNVSGENRIGLATQLQFEKPFGREFHN